MTGEYSAYPEEEEILIQDGLKYQIIDKTEEICQKNSKGYHMIKLQYPPLGASK